MKHLLQPVHTLRRGQGSQVQLLAPGAHRLQQAAAVVGDQQKGRIGGTFLQQLQHGVLGRAVQLLRIFHNIYLSLRLVGADIGVRADGPDLIHRDGLALSRAGHYRDIRMDPPCGLFAVGTHSAGPLSRRGGTHQCSGQQPRQSMPAGALRAAQNIGVGESASLLLNGELFLQPAVARKLAPLVQK